MYEQALERRDVAVRSMYRMYHNRLREDLFKLGLTEAQAIIAFADHPFPRSEHAVFETIKRCPEVAAAAERLLASYILIESDDRQKYYAR